MSAAGRKRFISLSEVSDPLSSNGITQLQKNMFLFSIRRKLCNLLEIEKCVTWRNQRFFSINGLPYVFCEVASFC